MKSLLVLALLCAPTAARAEPILGTACGKPENACQKAAFTLSKSEKISTDFDYDTGWLPPGAAVQVRLLVYLHGRTKVDMAGALEGTWPDPITLRPEPKLGSGALSTDDGLVVKAMGKFKVKVAGKDYGWEGDLPGVPKVDLGAVATTQFDPWAWKGGATPKTSAKTPKMELYKLDLTDSIIPIPGIGGGFDLDGQAEYTAAYETLKIGFDEASAPGSTLDVLPGLPTTRVKFSPAPFLDTMVHVHGQLTRGIALHFIPGLYIEILGKKFELDLADIPIALPASTKAFDFDPVATRLPLPRLEVRPVSIDLGKIPLGKPAGVVASLFNTGLAKLVLDAKSESTSLSLELSKLTIDPGVSDAIRGKLTPTIAGPFEVTINLLSNDPGAPKIPLRVRGIGVVDGATTPSGDPPPDGAESAAGSCTCEVTTGSRPRSWAGLTALSAALALLALRRRRAA